MENCEPGENVNHGSHNSIKLVHIIPVHIILVHENLNKNLKISLKNGREPELCEPFF